MNFDEAISDAIQRFNQGKLLPNYTYADLPLGEYNAEIVDVGYNSKSGSISVKYHIASYNLDLSQYYFIENSDGDLAKFFDFLKRVGIKEIIPETIKYPERIRIKGKKCVISVNISVSGSFKGVQIFKNALFIELCKN